MKYVALLRVEDTEICALWNCGLAETFYRSPVLDSRKEVENWLKERISSYGDSVCINKFDATKRYFMDDTIVCFDETESYNFENFLKAWIYDGSYK